MLPVSFLPVAGALLLIAGAVILIAALRRSGRPRRGVFVAGLLLTFSGIILIMVTRRALPDESLLIAQVSPTASLPPVTAVPTVTVVPPSPPSVPSATIVPPSPTVVTALPTPTVDQTLPPVCATYVQTLSVIIPTGNTRESVDVPRYAGGFGPQSFGVDRQGNIAICDTANRRVQVFAADGTYRMTIPVEAPAAPADIAVDDAGNLYVLDDTHGTLDRYDPQGRLQQRITVVVEQLRGPLHIVGETLYLSGETGDRPIGVIALGELAPVAGASDVMPVGSLPGIVGRTSGRLYAVRKVDPTRGIVEVVDAKGTSMQAISVVVPQLASIRFLQEDAAGTIYVQVERNMPEGTGVLLEVHTFDVQGRFICRIPIPENEYETWTVKLLDVGVDGSIYQFIPQFDGSHLNVFSPQE
ncbi:hypothetical protein [Roseiflexus sp.]|uniref:hypothetical protein n=1 Tax=Roseiflexus sp. TaxID=2562120 RepID=UPI00398B53AD